MTKQKILESNDYEYHFDRAIYFNKKNKKMFSREFIDDTTESQLQAIIHEQHNSDNWNFYGNFSKEIQDQIIDEL